MKILVVSDTHGDVELLYDIVSKHRLGTDLVIHLGDNFPDAESVMRDFPTIAFLGTIGNCDFPFMCSNAKYEGSFGVEGKRIFYTHGHKYNVKYGLDYLVSNAKFKGCDIALYGHSHVSFAEEVNGVLVINPGSLSRPRDNTNGTYCLLEINDKNVEYKILEVSK